MSDPVAFRGKTVLISGAAHGIGRGIAEAFARSGAEVWVCDVLARELDETVRRCREVGGTAEGRLVDVRDAATVRALVDEITARRGGVDILVHAAGGVLGQVWQPVEQVSDDDFHGIVGANLEGGFVLVRAVVPSMKARGWGRIITISSGAGRSYSQTGIQAYASAKAGLIGFTRQIARELGQFGITANSVAPGFVLSNPSSTAAVGRHGSRRSACILQRARHQAAGAAGGHCLRRALLRLREGELYHRPDPERGWRALDARMMG